MEERTIQMTIVKADSSAHFRSAGGTGPRKNGMPYYIELSDGSYSQEMITDKTDKDTLLHLIRDGKIWILKQHVEHK